MVQLVLTWKKRLVPCSLVALVFFFTFGCASGVPQREPETVGSNESPFTPEQLKDEFRRRPKTIKGQFVAKRMIVRGTVAKANGAFGEIVLGASNKALADMPSIHCQPDSQQFERFKEVHSGEKVLVNGLCHNVSKSAVFLRHCEIIEPVRP